MLRGEHEPVRRVPLRGEAQDGQDLLDWPSCEFDQVGKREREAAGRIWRVAVHEYLRADEAGAIVARGLRPTSGPGSRGVSVDEELGDRCNPALSRRQDAPPEVAAGHRR